MKKTIAPLEANSLQWSKFFPLRVHWLANRKSQKLIPFVNMIENHRGVLTHLISSSISAKFNNQTPGGR